jgi:hypothetical protein
MRAHINGEHFGVLNVCLGYDFIAAEYSTVSRIGSDKMVMEEKCQISLISNHLPAY